MKEFLYFWMTRSIAATLLFVMFVVAPALAAYLVWSLFFWVFG